VWISDFYGIIQLLRKHMCGFMVMLLNPYENLFQNFYQCLLDYAYDFLPLKVVLFLNAMYDSEHLHSLCCECSSYPGSRCKAGL
jgi:hypothetical protein